MDYIIKEIDYDSIEEAFALVKRIFLEVDAPDYSEEGIAEVMNDMIESNEFKSLFKTGKQKMLGAVADGKIIGVTAIGINNHISLFFVDSSYHRKGIGKALFKELVSRLNVQNVKEITLNSTPFAVQFYKKIGFDIAGSCVKKHGVLYTPMKYILR